MPSSGSNAAIHVTLAGRVQGVGFRDFTRREARRLGLTGWVRNRADGRVELTAEGPCDQLQQLIEELRRGPPGAAVADAEVEWTAPSGRWTDFVVRHGEV